MALRSTRKCAAVPATADDSSGRRRVSTLKILLLASKRWRQAGVAEGHQRIRRRWRPAPPFDDYSAATLGLCLEQDAAEVGQDLAQVGVEARGRGAVDHAVVPAQRQRQHQARLEGLAVPDRLRRLLQTAQDGDFGRVDDGREVARRLCRPASEIVKQAP